MFLITHSIIAMSSITFVLGLIYFYLFLQNHNRYMGFWGVSWIMYSLSFIFDLLKFAGQDFSIFIIEKQTFYLIISILFLFGSYNFWNKSIPKFWIYFSVISFSTIISATLTENFFLPLMLHSSIFLCFISVWNGLLFLTHSLDDRTSEKYLTGFIFIIWGIYQGYYPFIHPNFWLAPWSYLCGVVLINILSILILLLHFKKNKNEILKREKQFRLLAENAHDLIYLYYLNPTPRFEYISPAITKIMNLTPENLYSDPMIFFDTIHPEDKLMLQEIFTQPLTESVEPICLRWICKAGQIMYGELHHTIIYEQWGNVKGVEGILRDVTERKQVEENLLKIQKSRHELITNISHELRTPITLIQGYVEAMVDNLITDPKDLAKYLNIIHTKVLSLNRLINDLFQLTQLEAREIDFQFFEISIKNLIQRIYYKFELDVKNAGLELLLNVPNDDCIVTVDFDRIEQVFANLIYNSIKHTCMGGKISIEYIVQYNISNPIPSGNKNTENINTDYQIDNCLYEIPLNNVIIMIKDNGSGIPEDDLPHIFTRFYRGEKSNVYKIKGRGLGLSITKEIVESHGGSIWVDSKINQGTTFYFSLPFC